MCRKLPMVRYSKGFFAFHWREEVSIFRATQGYLGCLLARATAFSKWCWVLWGARFCLSIFPFPSVASVRCSNFQSKSLHDGGRDKFYPKAAYTFLSLAPHCKQIKFSIFLWTSRFIEFGSTNTVDKLNQKNKADFAWKCYIILNKKFIFLMRIRF